MEVAISDEAARAFGVGVGMRLPMVTDGSDALAGEGSGRLGVEVVGTFSVLDETDPFWFGDLALARPSIRSPTPLAQIQDVTALADPSAYAAFMSGSADGPPLRYTWRYQVDPVRLDAAGLGDVTDGLRRLESLFPNTGGGAGSAQAGTQLHSGLLALIGAHAARWGSAEAVLSVVAIGAAAVAGASLGLVVLLAAQRRRPAVALWQGRGASRGQVVSASLAEGLLLSVPAALVGMLLAVLVVPSGPAALTVALAAVAAGLATLLVVLAVSPVSAGTALADARAPVSAERSARRLVLEGAVVLMAAVGVVLLRDRSVRGAGIAGQLTTADPFVAAVPALVGLAAGLVVLRLFPIPMRALGRLAGRRRDLVPVLAIRRVTRGGSSGPVLLVLLATAAVCVFASATLVHLDRAADAAAWQSVGADYRLMVGSGRALPSLAPSGQPDVGAVAEADLIDSTLTGSGTHVQVLALDTVGYQSVVEGTPIAITFPDAMLAPLPGMNTGTTAGRDKVPVPAMISSALSQGPDAVGVGDQLKLQIDGAHRVLEVVAIRDGFASLHSGDAWIVVPRSAIEAPDPSHRLPVTSAYVRAGPDAAAGLAAAAVDLEDVSMRSEAQQAAAIRGAPVVGAVVVGVGAAALVVALYAALAVAASLALSGAARAVEIAHLRAVGLTRREALGLVVVEHGPTILVAFVMGTLLGLGLFALLRPGLGLDAVIGSDVNVSVGLQPWHLGIILGALVAVVLLGMLLAAWLQRRTTPAAALRRTTG